MLDKIKSLIDEIETNNKIISEKSAMLFNSRVKEIMDVINISRKYLVYGEIENIVRYSPNAKFNNLVAFNGLCKHAIKVGEYKSGSKDVNCYMNDRPGLYELWLLWNNEFCITRLDYINDEVNGNSICEREVIDYGKCAFDMFDNEFVWDEDAIIKSVVDNLEENSNQKKNTRNILESQLK